MTPWRRRRLGGFAAAVFLLAASPAIRQEPPAPADAKDAQASLVAVPAEVPKNARRYSMLLAGNRAGLLAAWSTPDGAHHAFYAFNDRGRGPSITTRAVVDASGLITQLDASGNDYLKSPVEERFRAADGKAEWKNKSEAGSKPLRSPALYAPLQAVLPDEAEQALLAAPGRRLPLLPEGEASIERVDERTVEVAGRREKVALYEESGFGFTPVSVWLDGDRRLFASGSDWSTLIREGAETAWPELLEAQKKHEAARGADAARRLGRRLAAPLLIRHARLFDSETAEVRDGMSVLVSGDRVVNVGPDGSIGSSPGTEVLDAKGKTLMPGLWDMHVHLGDWDDGILHVAAGVTTVRDMANDIDHLAEIVPRFDSGALIGPHVIKAGLIDGRGPYQGPTKVFADTPEEARADVERYRSLGYAQIKIYSSVKPELVPVIAQAAHRAGMRVSGHVPAFMTMEQAVAQGYDEVQHANFWFLNFLFDTVPDTRTPDRFVAVAQHAAELDLESDRVREFVQLLRDRRTVVDPTVNVFDDMFQGSPSAPAPSVAEVADRLPPQVRRATMGGGLEPPEGMQQRYRDSYAAMLRMLEMLYDAGVPVVAGTDAMAGFALHTELEQYVAAGIPAPKVLQIATLGAARVMRREAETGSIAPGKAADLILVDGDPAKRIADIRRVTTVIKGGSVYDAAALYGALGVRPASGATRAGR
jgi:cytosine/adenosine deaminase-related metal-dependent hydrolase